MGHNKTLWQKETQESGHNQFLILKKVIIGNEVF